MDSFGSCLHCSADCDLDMLISGLSFAQAGRKIIKKGGLVSHSPSDELKIDDRIEIWAIEDECKYQR